MPATVQSSPKAAFVCRFPAAVCPVLPGPDVLGSAQGAGTHPSAVQVYLHQERGVSHILAGVKPSWPLLVTCCIVDFPAAHQPMFEGALNSQRDNSLCFELGHLCMPALRHFSFSF
eukprot:1095391-Pelagomonas_calceolata.AAC.1